MQPLLSNVKVLDLSRILAGPWASQILADLGADVIKVERPGQGDDTRSWGPPFLKDEAGQDTTDGAYFIATNRGKRSITLDLQTAEGQALVKELCRDADVVLENYKVGTLARLGLDYDSLSKINPRLVYCSVTGFGQTGPRAAEPAYDFLIQAMGGLMSVTGERDDRPGGGPQKVGVPIVDLTTGVYAALGIVAALLRRSQTGQGEYIDVAMLDVQVGLLANQAMNFLLGNRVPRRTGTAHPNIQPQRTFACADGDIVIVVGNDAQFAALCRLLGKPELAEDPRFVSNSQRVTHQATLDPILDAIFITQPRAHWLAALKSAGVPAGSINTVPEVFDDPQVAHRAMLRHLPHPTAKSVPQVMNPLRFATADLRADRAPPLLGQHTADVLAELGKSAEQIDDLRQRKII
ncbi:CaiB/BaiF CoA transferase family protein [Achromobacter piechaudii]|uniref:Acetyl-CoA:oxalate CoA-transferase n=1 Tax=Achromobacter piechaudii TaxID=72556 RepID=A0ABN7EVV3_9BURK|nr:CaiB/BaiF CoA-transferase family protein [Achromobacter piechaudii]CAB3676890.1 Acetyl-CoA:oxalate CoA-transferase [Achromobacter piechaudii]CAB3841714.1 Acetyl-CoA:oxalate CoA-transferase [Achromobacter piechaudii]CAB3941862.1 Acetyl-CoA:oxalate CoA-transferase [Achromobacter piechaudii]